MLGTINTVHILYHILHHKIPAVELADLKKSVQFSAHEYASDTIVPKLP